MIHLFISQSLSFASLSIAGPLDVSFFDTLPPSSLWMSCKARVGMILKYSAISKVDGALVNNIIS